MKQKQKQIDKIEKYLKENNNSAGITPAKLAKLARVPKTAVYKVVYDLRHDRGMKIYNNFRRDPKTGERTLHYRMG